jgi:hypothetical protein
MSGTNLNSSQFAGLQNIFTECRQNKDPLFQQEVEDDYDGMLDAARFEALFNQTSTRPVKPNADSVASVSGDVEMVDANVPDLVDIAGDYDDDDDDDDGDDDTKHTGQSIDSTGIRQVLKEASKGVTDETEAEYRR